MSETVVIAIGGNSLIRDPKHVTVPSQYHAALETAKMMKPLLASDHRLALVHGNGPQVGFILQRVEMARRLLHDVPLDSCVADTQGALGYNIQTAIRNVLRGSGTAAGAVREVVALVSEVVVDALDPAFRSPSKPIGSFMSESSARKHAKTQGWTVVEDAGRGWRRVVPSPKPVRILELAVIRELVDKGVITIAAGGGGIPIVEESDGTYRGVEAVIDKDLAASLLARNLGADRFIISTLVEKVFINYRKPGQSALDLVTVSEARRLASEGHFAPGSMLPKIEAMIDFVEATGNTGVITDPEHLDAAVRSRAGTRFVPD